MKAKTNDKKEIKKIGVLTSGGDAPGMNAAIRAIVKEAKACHLKVLGCHDGYQGLIKKAFPFEQDLEIKDVEMILKEGGSILRSGRCKDFKSKSDKRKNKALEEAIYKIGSVDGLIVIGGDGTMQGARALYEKSGKTLRIIGIPASIDYDIANTDYSIGYHTALNTIVEAIDKLKDTATSHKRIMIVEVMGNKAGWLAFQGGVSGGADCIIIPDEKNSKKLSWIYDGKSYNDILNFKTLCTDMRSKVDTGAKCVIIVIAEGIFKKEVYKSRIQIKIGKNYRIINSAEKFGRNMQKLAGHETRHVVLSHLQRGGSPSPPDRFMSSLFGTAAIQYLVGGLHGIMIVFSNGKISPLRFSDLGNKPKEVRKEWVTNVESLTR